MLRFINDVCPWNVYSLNTGAVIFLHIQKIKRINSIVQLFHIFGHFSLLKVSCSVGCVLKSPTMIKNLSISPCHSVK